MFLGIEIIVFGNRRSKQCFGNVCTVYTKSFNFASNSLVYKNSQTESKVSLNSLYIKTNFNWCGY